MSLDIGKRLKQAREMQGFTLEDIAAQTRIPRKYLLAIENGQFDLLPSPIYVRSYVRSYANSVGENPQLLLRHYNPSAKTSTPRETTSAYPAVRKDLGQRRPANLPTRGRSTIEESSASRSESSYQHLQSESVQSRNRNQDVYESSQSRGEYLSRSSSYQEQRHQRDLSQTMSMRSKRYNPSSDDATVRSNLEAYSTYSSQGSSVNDESSTILEAEVVTSNPYTQKRRPTMPEDVPDPEELGIDSKIKRREAQVSTTLPSRSASTLSRTQRMQTLSKDDNDSKAGSSLGKIYNWLLIVGAIGLAIALIVILWIMNSEAEGSSPTPKTSVEAKQPDSSSNTTAPVNKNPILTLVATAPNGVDRWELSNAKQLDLKVEVAAGKETKLEIRDQEVGQPIVSTQVNAGKTFSKSLDKTIWITLSNPIDTTVTLNGKKLPTNGYKKEKTFHISLVN